MKQRRNIHGQLITTAGTLDKRALINPLPGPSYTVETLHKSGDSRPWHVIRSNLDTGKRTVVARLATLEAALKRAELERQLGPDKRVSRKLRHKLGIDQRNK